MLLCVSIDDADPRVVKAMLAYYLNGVAQTNRLLMASHRVPPLYRSGVRYAVDPDSDRVQRALNCLEVLERREADCKSLAAYRLGELRNACRSEEEAMAHDFYITHQDYDRDPIGVGLVPKNGVVQIFHVAIVKPNGATEDPSERLQRARA